MLKEDYMRTIDLRRLIAASTAAIARVCQGKLLILNERPPTEKRLASHLERWFRHATRWLNHPTFSPLTLGLGLALMALPLLSEAQLAPTSVLYFHTPPGNFIGAGITREVRPPTAAITKNGQPSDAYFSVSDGGESWQLSFSSPSRPPYTATPARLAVGAYEGAAGLLFRSPSPGLSFDGSSRYCFTLAGRFSVLEAAYDSSGTLTNFAASFVQYCDRNTVQLIDTPLDSRNR
jgi:hypothetical protein